MEHGKITLHAVQMRNQLAEMLTNH